MKAHSHAQTALVDPVPCYPHTEPDGESMADPFQSLHQVLASTVNNLLAHQTQTSAELLAAALVSTVPAFAPGSSAFWVQQIPTVCQAQWQRLAQAMLDSLEMVSAAQLQWMALGGDAMVRLSDRAGTPLASAVATVPNNGADTAGAPWGNRRLSATVIDFPDRRAKVRATP